MARRTVSRPTPCSCWSCCTIGQSAPLRVVPDAGVAGVLLANTEEFGEFCRDVYSEVLQTFASITMPAPLTPPAVPAQVELGRHVGLHERPDMRVEVSLHNGSLTTRVERIDAYAALQPPSVRELVAVSDGRFLEKPPGSTRWTSTVFTTSPGGADYLYLGTLAFPKVR
jgi:hypothetical protein